jgi:hypothetical protein
MATAANTVSTITEIDQALNTATQFLPGLLAFLTQFYPPAGAILPFLPLVQTALQGVETVEQAMGVATSTATQTVINHLTPGAPNAPALSETAPAAP